MTKIQSPQGQVMSLPEALALEDKNGDAIKWQEVEGTPGNYTYTLEEKGTKDKSGKKLAGHRYIYTIAPQPAAVIVTMAKQTVKSKEEAEAEAEAGVGGAVLAEENSGSGSKSKKSKY
jgi:hypothetical protein